MPRPSTDGGDAQWWRVEDGMITAEFQHEKDPALFFHRTTKPPQNFDLRLKLKLTGDPKSRLNNSGVQIHRQRVPNSTEMSVCQVTPAKLGGASSTMNRGIRWRRGMLIAECCPFPKIDFSLATLAASSSRNARPQWCARGSCSPPERLQKRDPPCRCGIRGPRNLPSFRASLRRSQSQSRLLSAVTSGSTRPSRRRKIRRKRAGSIHRNPCSHGRQNAN
jgi:hypothetical protein